MFDCVSADGVYLGGAIAPGMIGALESLTARAAQLFKVELVRPPSAIGKNSMHAIQSGMVFGFAGLVDPAALHRQWSIGLGLQFLFDFVQECLYPYRLFNEFKALLVYPRRAFVRPYPYPGLS